jgi:hypothetical protein
MSGPILGDLSNNRWSGGILKTSVCLYFKAEALQNVRKVNFESVESMHYGHEDE